MVNRLITIAFILMSAQLHAGKMNVCRNADGTTTFTDSPCPTNEQKIESRYIQESQTDVPQRNVFQQLKAMESISPERSRPTFKEPKTTNTQNSNLSISDDTEYRELLSDAENKQLSLTRRRWAREELIQKYPERYQEHLHQKQNNSSDYSGAINPQTGQFFPKSGSGIINPQTGEYYPKSGSGFINPRTGEFYPAN